MSHLPPETIFDQKTRNGKTVVFWMEFGSWREAVSLQFCPRLCSGHTVSLPILNFFTITLHYFLLCFRCQTPTPVSASFLFKHGGRVQKYRDITHSYLLTRKCLSFSCTFYFIFSLSRLIVLAFLIFGPIWPPLIRVTSAAIWVFRNVCATQTGTIIKSCQWKSDWAVKAKDDGNEKRKN